ncbi:hypothetical protein ACFW4X_19985 [Streptomyces smyrnaeus]|uniref:hypothetical protein n=1 Tax=Streptomyces smyrnaeus TaxID=1387713 RepID=UPI0033CC1D8F
MKLTKALTLCALAAGAMFATSGTATAASEQRQAIQGTCEFQVSSNKVTGSTKCSGVDSYRVQIKCSDGTTHYGVWRTSGWSIASCKFPQAITGIGAQVS